MRSLALGACLVAGVWGASPYRLAVPKGFPQPRIPADNPLTADKVKLGRYLFYDKRMSVNGAGSCGACHRQELAFTDGRARAVGTTGQVLPHSTMSLVNVAYAGALTWSNPSFRTLEEVAVAAMFAADPLELGVDKRKMLRLIRTDAAYRPLFPKAFPGEKDPYLIANVAKAIASFVRTIVSRGSPYDRFHFDGDADAIGEAAKRGEVLFFLDYGGPSCFRCHSGFNFTDAVAYVGKPRSPAAYHNNGLYNLAPPLSAGMPNAGLYGSTKNPADAARFKAPSLRNIALTAPYMHDGSIATLGEVVDHYAAGGRMGRDNPAKDPLVHGFFMTARNRADLVAFLESLTDESVTRDPKFEDPWRTRPTANSGRR